MLIVDIYGGPGSGKSTFAALLFAKVRMLGISAELVGEKAKEELYSGAVIQLENDLYLIACQYKRLSDYARNQVSIAISDAPLKLHLAYARGKSQYTVLRALEEEISREFHFINILIQRPEKFEKIGRRESEEEARQFDSKILAELDGVPIDFVVKPSEFASCVEDCVNLINIRLK